jgi:6-phosphogluconolactonase
MIIQKKRFKILLFSTFSLLCLHWRCAVPPRTATDERIIFVGTYTEKLPHVHGKATGIYTCAFNMNTGQLTLRDSATGIVNPSFVGTSPNKRYLYATSETRNSPDRPSGVSAYKIEQNGHLQFINTVPGYGSAPCYVSTSQSGKFAFVANYGSGNVITYKVRPDGGLGDTVCTVQHPGKEPHAHMIVPGPFGQAMWVVDKGANSIFVYDLSPEGRLRLRSRQYTSKDAGPRHLDFHPSLPEMYAVINELNSSMLLCRYNAAQKRGYGLDSLSTLPAGYTDRNTCADVHFHPNGRFLYGSNRGHNSIVTYAVDVAQGKLRLVGHTSTRGEIPRNFMVTPDGQWLLAANQNSSTVAVFKLDKTTGLPTPVGQPVRVPTPVCLKML